MIFEVDGSVKIADDTESVERKLKLAADVLSNDYDYTLSKKYEDSWLNLCVGLESYEPVERRLSLCCLKKASKSFTNTLISEKLKARFVKVLISVLSGDDNSINRCNAAFLLGECVEFMNKKSFSQPLLKAAFNEIVSSLLKVFPNEISNALQVEPDIFDKTQYIDSNTFQMRIYLLRAVGKFFRFSEANSPTFMHYIDALFTSLLKPKVSEAIKITIIKILTDDLPFTNRNRLRIEKYYRHQINSIKQKKESKHKSTGLEKYLLSAVNQFLSTWFPQITDKNLVKINPTSDQISRMNEGYARRRWQWLFGDGKKLIRPDSASLSNPITKINAFKKGFQMPYAINNKLAELDPEKFQYCYYNRKKKNYFFQEMEVVVEKPVDFGLDYFENFKVPTEIPDLTNITFNNPNLVLTQSPGSKDLYLQNKSLIHDYPFSIQVGLYPKNIHLFPSTGILPKGENILIKVDFLPTPYEFKKNHELNLYLRVRSDIGICSERIALKAQNLPAVKILPSNLNFNLCPIGETRTMLFSLTNILDVDCSSFFFFKTVGKNAAFQILQNQVVLLPKEKKFIPIKFTPTNEGEISTVLTVVSYGGDIRHITVSGVCGNSLSVLDTKIEFGPVDISYSGIIKRKIKLKNNDPKFFLPVSTYTSTAEIVVNNGHPILLGPGEEKKFEIGFNSDLTGSRSESVNFFAPNSKGHLVEISSFSGPTILTPLIKDIFFSVKFTDKISVVQFPITNLSTYLVHVVVYMPNNTPFTMRLLNVEVSNNKRNSIVGTIYAVESKPYSKDENNGLYLTISGRTTAVIELSFSQSCPGIFRSMLLTQVLKPRKTTPTEHSLSAVAIDYDFLSDDANVVLIREFLSDPSMVPDQKTLLPSITLEKTKKEVIFELEPPVQVVYYNEENSSVDCVILTNMGKKKQNYHVFVTYPFYVESMDDEIEPQAVLEIRIGISREAFFNDFPETKNYSAIGSISIYNDENLEVLSSTLVGVYKQMLFLEVRDTAEIIKFSNVKLLEKVSKRLFLRNKSPFEMIWEGRVISLGQKGAVGNGTSGTAEWCPFNLSTNRITLKEYEVAQFEIHFQAHVPGNYISQLSMDYKNPNLMSHTGSSLVPGSVLRHSMNNIVLECSAGLPEISISPDCVLFGDAYIGESIVKSFTITNAHRLNADITITTTSPEFTFPEVKSISFNSKLEILLTFTPTSCKCYDGMLIVSCDGLTKNIPVSGFGRKVGSINSNLGSFSITRIADVIRMLDTPENNKNRYNGVELKAKSSEGADFAIPPKNVYDFGLIDSSKPKLSLFKVTNSGHFDIYVKNVISSSPVLTWKVLEDATGSELDTIKSSRNLLANCATTSVPENWAGDFMSLDLDKVEVDWDEIDNHLKESGNAKLISRKPSVANQISINQAAARKKKYRASMFGVSSGATASGKEILINSIFPLRIPPFQSAEFLISIMNPITGVFNGSIQILIEKSATEIESHQLTIAANFQPALQLLEKKVSFGVKAVHERHKSELKFTNLANIPLSWVLKHDSLKLVPLSKFSDTFSSIKKNCVRNPFEIFPMEGKLMPGCTQSIDLTFTPNIPQHENTIVLHGIGASSCLVADKYHLDFGVLRLGTFKIFKLKLKNQGILQARYFVECENKQYSIDPEQGMLDGDGSVELTVKYFPRFSGNHKSLIKIIGVSTGEFNLSPLTININGVGSYPELVVLTKIVDFGTALFGTTNVKPIMVENKGAAEAHVMLNCHHKGITLEKGDLVVIPPYSAQSINIVYIPLTVEFLDIKVFLRSSDSRGDYFMVHLKGLVGVPKLTTYPIISDENMDFGVCRTHQTHAKEFKMTNDGNIPLNFTSSLELLQVSQIVRYGFVSAAIERNDVSAVKIEPVEGHLPVGQSVIIKILFSPSSIADYTYKFTLNYDFKKIDVKIKGTGGQAILKVENQLQFLDFGVCRLDRYFKKVMTLSNSGNLGVKYIIRPEPINKDWSVYDEEIRQLSKPQIKVTESEGSDKSELLENAESKEEAFWVAILHANGFDLPQPNASCAAYSKTDLLISFCPISESFVSLKLKIFMEGGYIEDVELRGCAAKPKLSVYDSFNPSREEYSLPIAGYGAFADSGVPSINLGVHSVNSESTYFIHLSNEGPFGCDFLIQPTTVKEFDVYPKRGFIESGVSLPLKIYFRPYSENKYQMPLRICWEGEPIKLNVVGAGGLGKLEVAYLDPKDEIKKGIDFGDVPFNSATEKRWLLYNVGMVTVSVSATVENDEYSISMVGDAFPWQGSETKQIQEQMKRQAWNWYPKIQFQIPPSMCMELGTRFFTNSSVMSPGNISIRSECSEFLIPLRGKGGSVNIGHRGDLSLGDIASNFTYSRKIILTNSGSISTPISLYWFIVGHSAESTGAVVKLVETYSAVDPRGGWARSQVMKEKAKQTEGSEPVAFASSDYWKMIKKMILKDKDIEKTEERSTIKLGTMWDDVLNKIHALLRGSPPTGEFGEKPASSDSLLRGLLSSSRSANALTKKGAVNHSAAFLKRRQMFFHLITNLPVSSQSSVTTKPFIGVEPRSGIIPHNGELTLQVQANLSTEDTFLATLVVKSQIPNVPNYEIPLTATPKAVNIICNDNKILNFFRQPIGETETISRTFTNIGHKDIQFTVVNTNNFLSIFPNKGVLKVGQTVNVDFTFKPINECIQNQDVIFEPDCSQNIRFKMFGAGGHVICSLSKYRRFDFGQCMIGKETVSHLPIVNEGTAVLHLSNFQLIETETFYKGATWPSGRISLHQGQVYNLPIIFNPREESPQDGKLIVSTLTESWEIELVGLGREAVLIVSKVALEFTECLIGNAYEQKLGLKNVGDVNYPISVNLDKEFTDISFFPKSMVIQPFSDGQILITYTPSSATKMNVVLVILSPYSSHKIPILLHAGTASIEFSTNTLDFGMFEKLSKPTLPLRLKNTGTVSTSYSIKDVIKPSMFSISNNKGILGPGKFVDVGVTFIRHEVCDFKESIVVKTDLINKTYSITVVGQCEEAVIHADEITFVSMGICPVLDPTTHILNLKNYGKFPLSFTIKSAYPLKCSPVSGVVAGDDTKPLMITWTPSGAYELRTQITLVSNIGNINITVRGKSNFPELAVRSSQVDYGVCAVGFSYKEVVTLINKGRVPLQFSIVPPREIAFATSKVSAVLAPKQETDVKVSFTPTATGRYTTGLVIECRGINYKEVVLTGIGANMKFDIIPQAIDLGRCSYGLQSSHILLLKNSGDVAILAAFSQKDSESHCTIFCPEAVQVNPRESVRCPYSITVNTVGKFQTHLHVSTRENNYSIPISGTGLKIILSKRSQEILEKENLDILNFSDPLTGWMYLDRDNYIFHKKIRNNLKTDLLLSELFSMLLSIVKSQSNEGVQNNSNADILKQVDHSINNIRNSLCTGTISKSIDCDANDERENGHNGIHVDGLVENSGDILRPIPLEEITHSHEMFSNAATIEEVEAHSDFSDAKITVAEEEAINIHPESELVNNSISDVIKDDVIKNLTEDKNQQDDLKIVENFFNIELISPLPTEDTGSEIRIPTAKLDSRECSAEDMELKEPQPLQVLNNEVKIIAVEEAAIELEEVATLIEKVDGLKNEELELVQVHETKNIQIDTLDNDEKSNHEQLDANNNNFDESKSNSESIEQPNVNEEVLGTEFSNVISNEALEEAQITDTRISSTDDYSEKIKCESASNQTKTDLESKEKILDENECDVFTPEYQQNTYSTQNMFSTNKSTTSVVNDTIGDTIKDDRSHNDGQQVFSELAATNLEDNEKIHEPVEVNFSSTADNSILGGEGCATISENVATTNLQDEIVIQQNSDSDTHENVKSESNETNAESIIGAGGQNLVLQSNIKQIEDSSTENTEHFNNLEYKIEQNVEKITTEEGIPKFTRQELLEKLLEVKETVFELTNTSVLEGQYLNEFFNIKKKEFKPRTFPEREEVITNVINRPYPIVQEYYYDILDMIEPRTHVEIEIVLARPPAIDVEKVAKQPQNLPLDMPSKTHYNKWGEFPQFRRNLRNALTVTSFADPYSFPTGVGVNIFRSYQDSEKDKKQH